eukprot:992948-Rhodomonas_salina.2
MAEKCADGEVEERTRPRMRGTPTVPAMRDETFCRSEASTWRKCTILQRRSPDRDARLSPSLEARVGQSAIRTRETLVGGARVMVAVTTCQCAQFACSSGCHSLSARTRAQRSRVSIWVLTISIMAVHSSARLERYQSGRGANLPVVNADHFISRLDQPTCCCCSATVHRTDDSSRHPSAVPHSTKK